MNGRVKIGFGLAVLCALFVIILRRQLSHPPPLSRPAPSHSKSAATSPTLSSPTVPSPNPIVSRPSTDGKSSAIKDISAASIEFYGRVIDQDGEPLPGV